MRGERIYSGSEWEEAAGYARAVVTGDWILVSGTSGWDPETKRFPPDIEMQTENCFRTIGRALEQAGASLDDLVRVVIHVASAEEFERAKPIIKRYCGSARPANTTVLAQLLDPAWRIEIEATARKA